MIELRGKYNTAKVFTNNVEQEAISQIIELCNQEFVKDSQIRIMPDTHAGAGCTIGTTMTITDKIVPNLVGVDIGCGMETVQLQVKEIDLDRLDKVIHNYVPAGFDIRDEVHRYSRKIDFNGLRCKHHVNIDRANLSIGTLGGGNHFIEVDRDDEGNLYLVVHSGSRNLGKQVAEYYQDLAYKSLTNRKQAVSEIIARLKQEGREKDIQSELAKIKQPKISKDLAYVEGSDFEDYLHDMNIVQQYAMYNRMAIVKEILDNMGLSLNIWYRFSTIHNHIDIDDGILRKGAISAQEGEEVLIPINMRDGSLICIGKGNPDWNCSAPHGAGRLMSRSKAKETINIDEFKETMNGIYSSTVNQSTLDEAPMAYKPMDEIIANIQDTVEISKIIKPIYNFKAAD
ncbi:MAG: RtcB family protein [Bacteroidota bacterium]|nr:RtcB family protein [Bacteroidota bacterium]